MELQPIDDFLIKGFQQRFQQQFGCECFHITTNESTTIAQLAKDGRKLEYPYAFITIQSTGPNPESYSANNLARHGLVAVVEDNNLIAHRVRIIPTNFDCEIRFVTNQYKSTAQGSYSAFIRRWLWVRRIGAMSFSIKYGRINAGIQVTLSDSVPFAPRENAPDTETAYQVVTNAVIHGYVSEPELGTSGIVSQIALQELLETKGLAGGTFIPFN